MPTIFGDKVTVGAVTFNDPAALPVGAVKFQCDTILGWDETAEIDIDTVAVGGDVDGEILPDVTPDKARHMVLSGWAWCASRADAEAVRDVLIRDAFPKSTPLTITRYEAVPKFVTAQVSGKREFSIVEPHNFRWTVPVSAGDPFKYAAIPPASTGAAGLSTGGRTYPRTYPLTYGTSTAGEGNALSLFNAGNVASSNLILEITGPLSAGGWRVVNDTYSQELSFDTDVAATDTLTIDFREGVALLNGYPIGSLIVGQFWKLYPGINVVKLFADFDAAVSITATGYSAWE